MDPAADALPETARAAAGEGPVSAEATGGFPELGELGDEDIIADGGTQIMARDPRLESRDGSKTSAPTAPSSLDSLAATIPAKNVESKFVAPSKLAKVPPPPKTEPIHELDPDDLEEDEQRRIERTQPFDRSRIFGAPRPGDGLPAARTTQPSAAWRPAPVPRLEVVLSPTPPPVSAHPTHARSTLPSVVINDAAPPHNRPASIAPLAIDVAPPRPLPDATLKLPAIQHPPRAAKSSTPIIAGAIAGGLALCAAAVITLVTFTSSRDSETSSKSTPTVAATPREAQKGAVRSAVIETPETALEKAPPPPGAPDEDGLPVYSPGALPSAPAAREGSGSSSHAPSSSFAQAPRAATKTVQPSAAPEPAAAPVAAAPAPAPRPAAPAATTATTGTIEVPGSLMTVMIDGDYKRVQGGRIVVTCGKHRVNAGRGTQMVDVPCGGVASVM